MLKAFVCSLPNDPKDHPMHLFRFLVLLLLGFGVVGAGFPSASNAQMVVVSIRVAPPPLPVYVQPVLPAPGYIWTPGYWAYVDDDYYWVPGTWVEPPSVGLLWTPAYWVWRDGGYVWRAGYWGPHIGFYGGINYGYGYGGTGYEGGYWRGGVFSYNTTVNNFGGAHVTNVYNKTVINNTSATNVSFQGGPGGTTARPSPQEQTAAHDQHIPPTAAQFQHQHIASTNPSLRASVNHGSPTIAATSKPGVFTGPGVVGARRTNGPANGSKPMGTNTAITPSGKPQTPIMAHPMPQTSVHGNTPNTTHINPPPTIGAPAAAVTPHPKQAVVRRPPPVPHPSAPKPPAKPKKKPSQ
jgi:hypothetical protein